jgi:hypothetical protein
VAAAGIIGKSGVRARGVVDHRHLPGIIEHVGVGVAERRGVAAGLPRAEIAPLLHRTIRQGEARHIAAGAVGKVARGPAPIGDGRDPAIAVVGVGVGFALGVGGRDEPPRVVIGAAAGAAEFIRERRHEIAEVVDYSIDTDCRLFELVSSQEFYEISILTHVSFQTRFKLDLKVCGFYSRPRCKSSDPTTSF